MQKNYFDDLLDKSTSLGNAAQGSKFYAALLWFVAFSSVFVFVAAFICLCAIVAELLGYPVPDWVYLNF